MKIRTSVCSLNFLFLFLVVSVLTTTLWSMNGLKLLDSLFSSASASTSQLRPTDAAANITLEFHEDHQNFCTFRPLSPEEALEEKLLLASISWPATLVLPEPVSLKQTSDPAHSAFTLLPRDGGGQWRVGDQLEVLIEMRDFRGIPKTSGGDVLLARLHDSVLGAGVAGRVVDHLNGSYSALFSLPWEGSAQVEVTLVHPSEGVTVLRRLTSEEPDRVTFQSLFRSGRRSETTACNLCLRPSQQPLCNYTDPRTGEPWFCVKPRTLECRARISHAKGTFHQKLRAKEEKLFQSGVNMKVSIPAFGPDKLTILPNEKGAAEVKSRGAEPPASGYYYGGVWRALGGNAVHQFNTSSAVSQCLKGKAMHFYGDSTVRQWYEHLVTTVPELKEFNIGSDKQVGPFMALDYANHIMVTYRCHGPPIRFASIPASELRYIANELDGLIGGANTVVVIGIWSHFSTFPIQVYIRRLLSIRGAVERLLDRAPDTLVVVRAANPKALTLYETLTNSDWYSLRQNKVLRAVFRGLKVQLVDAWEMSLAHGLPHSLHPQPPIVKNMIDVLLSYVCAPSSKGWFDFIPKLFFK